MSILDSVRNGLRNFIFGNDLYGIEDRHQQELQVRRDYREGRHREQIKARPGKSDDNVYINFTGLIVDRSVEMLFGNGVIFDLPGEGDDTPEDLYINGIWDANKREIFLQDLGISASEAGTGYVKIVRDGVIGKDGAFHPRFVLVDPKWVMMDTNPEDFEEVIQYTIRFDTVDAVGKEIARKQEHTVQDNETWLIQDFQASSATGGRWELMQSEIWPYSFPQILHFKNLPNPFDVYGSPDLTDDIIGLQDDINRIASNTNKIIRLWAHPKLYAYGMGADNKEVVSLDVGEMIVANDPNAFFKALEMQSDLKSSAEFLQIMRQCLFDVARTVDIDSVTDKLGALTNFGLRVLYQDAVNKVSTKQHLYGEALLELNRRLLVIGGMNPDPGEVIWPDPLPVNGVDLSAEIQMDMGLGIVSKQTAAAIKQYDWEQEMERMEKEQAQGGNIGAQILKAFETGEL